MQKWIKVVRAHANELVCKLIGHKPKHVKTSLTGNVLIRCIRCGDSWWRSVRSFMSPGEERTLGRLISEVLSDRDARESRIRERLRKQGVFAGEKRRARKLALKGVVQLVDKRAKTVEGNEKQ